MVDYSEVEDSLDDAKAIAWDGCHKIYVLMDHEQVQQMREYGYDPLITADEQTPNQMLETIIGWYESSCGLRFVEAVWTNHEDPNLGFESLIPQGADWEEDSEDEDEDEDSDEDED